MNNEYWLYYGRILDQGNLRPLPEWPVSSVRSVAVGKGKRMLARCRASIGHSYGVEVVIHRFDDGIPKLPALAVFHYFIYGVGEFCVGIGIEIVPQGEQPDGYLPAVVPVHSLSLRCWMVLS